MLAVTRALGDFELKQNFLKLNNSELLKNEEKTKENDYLLNKPEVNSTDSTPFDKLN